MTIHFGYDKKQVIQALRYHFLMRPEIKILLVFVNLFTILSAVLLYLKKIQPISFLVFSLLWFVLMLVIWRVLPASIYRRSRTFKDHFILHLEEEQMVLETERGTKGWHWAQFSYFIESHYFFHLYFDERSFFLVPKDAFTELPVQQAARELLRSKVPGKSLSKRK